MASTLIHSNFGVLRVTCGKLRRELARYDEAFKMKVDLMRHGERRRRLCQQACDKQTTVSVQRKIGGLGKLVRKLDSKSYVLIGQGLFRHFLNRKRPVI